MQMDKAAVAGLVAIPLLFGAQAANAITSDQVRSLTYEEVKGTGLANRCTELTGTNGEISINSKNKFKIADLCLEPKSFQIEQEVNTRKKGGNSKGELRFCFLQAMPCIAFSRLIIIYGNRCKSNDVAASDHCARNDADGQNCMKQSSLTPSS